MRLPDLIIPNGDTESQWEDILPISIVTLYGPAALTGAIDIEVSPDGGATAYSLATAVGAGARVQVSRPQASVIRVVSTMAEAAQRNFPMYGSDEKRS